MTFINLHLKANTTQIKILKHTEVYLEPCQTSMMELYARTDNAYAVFAKKVRHR